MRRTSLNAAENDRTELSRRVSKSVSLLQQLNESQTGISADLKLQGKALNTLQGTVDEARISHEQTYMALKSQAETLEILWVTVERSKQITNQIQAIFKIDTGSNETPETRRTKAIEKSNDVDDRKMKESNPSNSEIE